MEYRKYEHKIFNYTISKEKNDDETTREITEHINVLGSEGWRCHPPALMPDESNSFDTFVIFAMREI